MLAELAACNAAFSVIKTALANSGELASAGKALGTYFNQKNALEKKVNKKGGGSELEEFLALEKLKQQEDELRELMIWQGRPGLWQDWVQHQALAARERKEIELEATRKKIRQQELIYWWFEVIVGTLMAIGIVGGCFYGVYLWYTWPLPME
tara:strand:- start:1501 stop:1956 length:456 start_codon:yes stop_codon:yes gene_type:complete